MKNRDIIFTGMQALDVSIGSNAVNIATTMSRQNRVLYVNPPESYAQGASGNEKSLITKINDSLFTLNLPIRTFPVGRIGCNWLFDKVNYWNNKRIALHINRAMNELGMKNCIHINDNDVFRGFYMKELLSVDFSVYYRRDWLFEVDYWKRHVGRLEAKLVEKSDLILTNSPYLATTVEQFNPRTFCVGQGVDLSLYDSEKVHERPSELSAISSPIVGYVGAISSLRLDPDLIYETAKTLSEINFVMLGPEDEGFVYHKLHTLPNVIFIEGKRPADLPTYIAHFDICINPQVLNDTTKGNYPRKIDEYLAMGKPTIATDTPTMQLFAEVTYLCTGVAEYVAAISDALANDSEEKRTKRIALAHSHSWENSVEEMYCKITEYERF